jgi:hypothetical protein
MNRLSARARTRLQSTGPQGRLAGADALPVKPTRPALDQCAFSTSFNHASRAAFSAAWSVCPLRASTNSGNGGLTIEQPLLVQKCPFLFGADNSGSFNSFIAPYSKADQNAPSFYPMEARAQGR